jgi:hypothetical protein
VDNIGDHINLLETFRIGLINGVIEKSRIINWADHCLQLEDEPDSIIIELSLCGRQNVNEIISAIDEFIGENKPVISARAIFGFLYQEYSNKSITLKKVVFSIDWITLNVEILEEEKCLMNGIGDGYYLAESKAHGTIESIENEVLRFLNIYKEFKLEYPENWNKVNNFINENIKKLSSKIKAEQDEAMKEYKKHNKLPDWLTK